MGLPGPHWFLQVLKWWPSWTTSKFQSEISLMDFSSGALSVLGWPRSLNGAPFSKELKQHIVKRQLALKCLSDAGELPCVLVPRSFLSFLFHPCFILFGGSQGGYWRLSSCIWVQPRMSRQLTTVPRVSIEGFATLLKGTSAAFWPCPGTAPLQQECLPSFVHFSAQFWDMTLFHSINTTACNVGTVLIYWPTVGAPPGSGP